MASPNPYTTLPEVLMDQDPEYQYRPQVPPKDARLTNTGLEPVVTEPSMPLQSSAICCVCARDGKAWYCVQCGSAFCDECWPRERPHWVRHRKRLLQVNADRIVKPGKLGIDGRPHEKVDEEVITRLSRIFSQPPLDEQTRRHESDANTVWFGVRKDAGNSFLHYSNRLIEILRDSQVGQHSERFPQLVSFVGQTGAGKSTVVKMLIDRERARMTSAGNFKDYPVPVPGLVDDNIPTTCDVHLYEDPGTCFDQRPVLYADCEGMTGGEAPPRGLTCRDKLETAKRTGQFVKNKLRKRLAWADNPNMQSREYAVKNLFPRILYTFSDVVVFVLREVRTFQTDVLLHLLSWAATSIDKSINQPTRPHIVIVVNATDVSIDENQWDPETATRRLLDAYQDSVHQVPALQDLLTRLSLLDKRLTTTKELLEYFYSSVSVVRVPAKGRYMKMDEQIGRLYHLIGNKCAISHAKKKAIRMHLNARRLPQYVNSAYDHFSRRLDKPFDFAEEARRHAPLPQDFSGHILNLIICLYSNDHQRRASMRDFFVKLSLPIASCIILDATRDNTQGSYSTLLRHTYNEPLWEALRQFCDYWLKCSFQKGGHHCGNVKSFHDKGHQASTGKVLQARASYESNFLAEDFFPLWIDEIDKQIKELQEEIQQYYQDDSATIAKIHMEVMADFYKTADPGRRASDFKSNSTCLCCVNKIPENVLACGHALCKSCIQAYGDDSHQGLFKLHSCPLHPQETYWKQPISIKFKPAEAGVRILCLDGGGVRGIIELVVLQAIEEALGHHVPVQNFFDLIVGTSTGGIIALGLGVKRWSVSDCIKNFKSLCGDAFTARPLKPLAVVSHRSSYRTKPLEKALQSAFDLKSPLYGGLKSGNSTSIRVAVTSTLATDNCPVILSNYNTEAKRDDLPYKFIRPRDPASELKIWEAARATAAAPMYFKPFVQEETSAAYTDGAIWHNCPAVIADHERRLLWGDVSDWPPDIFLSVGTGMHNPQGTPPTGNQPPSTPRSRHKSSLNPWSISGISYMFRTAANMIDDQLSCEEIWRQYHAKATAPGQIGNGWDGGRNIRLNVEFERERPPLDKVDKLETMERYALNAMRDNPRIDEVANRLVASCFYFEKTGNYSGREFMCTGNIHCRFDEGSQELKGLGRILRDHIKGPSFVPFFFLDEDYGLEDQTEHEIEIPTKAIDDMCHLGFFKLPKNIIINAHHQSSVTQLSLCLQPEGYFHRFNRGVSDSFSRGSFPISGFPRKLFDQDSLSPTQPEEGVEGDDKDASAVQDWETVRNSTPPRPRLEVPKPGIKGSRLLKSLSRISLSPKLRSPGGNTSDNWSGKGASPGGFSDRGPSPGPERISQSSSFSFESAGGRLEADSIPGDEQAYLG